MNCEICKMPYNLANRTALILPCCGDSICRECITMLAGAPQHEFFKCPIQDCGQPNISQFHLKENKLAEKILKQSIRILCDIHLNEQVEYYQDQEKKFYCKTCMSKEEKKNENSIKIDRQAIVEYNSFILGKLKIENDRIRTLIQEIEAYQNNERSYTATQYLKLVNDSQDILKPRLNYQEKLQLNLLYESQKLMIDPQESLLLKQEDYQFLQECLKAVNFQIELIYRATRDGFGAQDFHHRCDNQGPTLIIIKSEHNQIFGGYTSVSWTSPEEEAGRYFKDSQAILFSLSRKEKYEQINNTSLVVNHKTKNGPTFGGHDIIISDGCDKNWGSWSGFGNTFQLPNGLKYETEESRSYLAGSFVFKVREIEIFKVQL